MIRTRLVMLVICFMSLFVSPASDQAGGKGKGITYTSVTSCPRIPN